jgi:protein required for attachment to host cells
VALAQLAHEFRHYQQEHDREAPASATRHVLSKKMQRTEERFGRLVREFIEDEALSREWTKYLHEGGATPPGLETRVPPLFKGVDEAGSRVEIRPSEDGGFDIVVDSAIESHETVSWYRDPDMIGPTQIGQHVCRESTDVPLEALQALDTFLRTPQAEPPWQWLRALIDDGVIDANFSLTPRGDRLLGKSTPRAVTRDLPITFGVLAADGARARLFVLRTSSDLSVPSTEPLVEVSASTRPDSRTRDHRLFTDTRPGTRQGGPGTQGSRHGVNDHRENHRRAAEQRFATEVVQQAERVFREHDVTRVVVVASPSMLGVLRPNLERTKAGAQPWSTHELARDLTKLAPPAIHDALADGDLLPPRGRMPAILQSPGRPI